MLSNNKKGFTRTLSSKVSGFTLIELLVVVAIISLLSSIVFASLNTARAKGRDARRISDIRQLQNALELYRNDKGFFPDNLLDDLVTSANPDYIASIPTDPLSTGGSCRPAYCYAYSPATTTPSSYHLGAQMENLGGVLGSDSDFNSSTGGYSGPAFDGVVNTIYDIKY